jgi:hypothetical protein
MPAIYVTAAELKSALGVGTLYDSGDVIETCCQTSQDLINEFLDFNSAPVTGASIVSNVATLALSVPARYVIGQTLTVSGCGSTYNGSQVITGVLPGAGITQLLSYPYPVGMGVSFIQFTKVASDDTFHAVIPYGKALGPDTKATTYALTGAIREAALLLAVDIFQARQAPASGGMIDGMTPSPYRMGNNLMGKIRGLLAPYASSGSMVG